MLANGSTLASSAYNATTQWGVNSSTRHLFEVDWNVLTGMTVKLDGTAIFTNVATPGFTPQAGDRMVWAARCDSMAEYVRLDNLAVASGGNLVQMTTGAPYYTDVNSNSPVHPPSSAFDQNRRWIFFR